jgi:hypothetical protein
MKKAALLFALFACLLTPSTAHANDGGFWDMLFRWDTKFSGYGTDFHLVCLTKSGEQVHGCEEWFTKMPDFFHPGRIKHSFATRDRTTLLPNPVTFDQIRHEVNLRVAYFHSYGQRVPDAKLAASDTNRNDHRTVHAIKIQAIYYFRINQYLDIGAGQGVVPLFGDDVTPLWRGITTVSFVVAPKGRWFARLEGSYYTHTITGADLGHPTSTLISSPGWNGAAIFGFDLRRIGP